MILGIWDGHDAGACLLDGSSILCAVNEERLTGKKLEVGFPGNSITRCLKFTGKDPGEIQAVSISTSDLAKTAGRVFPFLPRRHYLLRRRKKYLPFVDLQKKFKYWITTFGPNRLYKAITGSITRSKLKEFGLQDCKIFVVDHHLAHACGAGFCSPFESATIITMDGLGDGISGSARILEGGKLEPLHEISASDSLGIFFEQVTYLLGMRELEDEGKVMALADYSLPVPDTDNPLLDLFEIDGIDVRSRLSPLKMFDYLKKIFWKTSFEQFARMAQDTLEKKVTELVRNIISHTGNGNLCLAGGVFANVKLNMSIRNMPEVDGWYIFPHMGDGGLALSAAALTNYELNGISKISMKNIFLGPEYDEKEIENSVRQSGLHYKYEPDIARTTARLINEGKIILWFQGRSEYGPRALGHRSILAPADSIEIKDALNLKLKRRSWFQPFCPTILKQDAYELLSDYNGEPSPFMTMAYKIRPQQRDRLLAVISVDGTCRPQILDQDDDPLFRACLENYRELSGIGCILNTSFNIHGEPLVETPDDAIKTMKACGFPYLVIGNYLVFRGDVK
ncbi:MAG: hypothetical protein J7M18_08055 [Candidatus Eremiobacteraeota bacterium]|nr:hypothetical protein [Candidatus Eremiobacteraeota bacterium]